MHKLEYLWLDGCTPTQIRSKTKIVKSFGRDGGEAPIWGFDGSSTEQAKGSDSDCVLKPVRVYPNPLENSDYASIVLCVWNVDDTPHETNTRRLLEETITDIEDDIDEWVGFEQEYTLFQDGRPYGWPKDGTPRPQGDYYCGVGASNVVGREISETHMDACLAAGIMIAGTNAEVALGQWEYQCFGKGLKAGDDLWVSRYLLQLVAEDYGVSISFHPKPQGGDWNGSGMHANFSNNQMRNSGSKELMYAICEKLKAVHSEGIAEYGSDNDMRLTGLHETQSIDQFSYAPFDRGASIRIPIYTVDHNWNGYLEDRRPASNADPYRIMAHIVGTLSD